MYNTVAIAACLVSLGLVCVIYYCNILSHPASRLRGELLAMILVALFTGIFPLAVASAVTELWEVVATGGSLNVLAAKGAYLAAIAALLATAIVFGLLVRATYRAAKAPETALPNTPQPANSAHQPSRSRLAA